MAAETILCMLLNEDRVAMGVGIAAIYGVFVVQGIVLATLHCPGMCGPLVLGFAFPSTRSLVAYQCGKSLMYAGFGALAGWAGQQVTWALQAWGPVVIGIAGLAIVIRAGWQYFGSAAHLLVPSLAPRLAGLVRRIQGVRHPFLTGMILSFLPCGVIVWAMSLAVASASPVHGAILGAGVMIFSTPILAIIRALGGWTRVIAWRQRYPHLVPLSLALSGLWLFGWSIGLLMSDESHWCR